jgi:hypothetical protein
MERLMPIDREISEPELIVPALEIMCEQHDGFVSTSRLIRTLTGRFPPQGRDAEIAINRSDTYFSQKVRNLVSHRHSTNSFIQQGLAEYDRRRRGLRITELGRAALARIRRS